MDCLNKLSFRWEPEILQNIRDSVIKIGNENLEELNEMLFMLPLKENRRKKQNE